MLGALAAVYGFSFGVYGEFEPVGFMVPLVVLLGLLLWVMPITKYPPVRLLRWFFPGFVYALLCWPDYLAVELPNLPWITAVRLLGVPMVIVLLLCSFTSPRFRTWMSDVFDGDRLILRLAITFIVICGLSVLLSRDMAYSMSKFVIAAWSYFGVFAVACYYFSKRGNPQRFARMLVYITLFSIVVGLYEARFSQLPWAQHIPSFLEIQDENIKELLAGTARAATGIYRVQSKFSTSIGLGEFFGLALPFIMHLVFSARRLWVKWLIFIIIPVAFYISIRTDSRLSFITFVSSVMLYILFRAYITWRREKSNLFAPAVMLIYPLMIAVFVVLAFTWRRVGVLVFGTGAQQFSTEARKMQWARGWPKIFKNPFGYGIGTSNDVLDFHTPGTGRQTIDSYYLGVLLEFGFIGFIVFYGMFIVAAYQAGRASIRTNDDETLFLGAAAIALVNFLVTKSIYSQLENNSLGFILLGLVVALLRRYKAERGVLPALPEDDGLTRPKTFQVKHYGGMPQPA
ncbi:MAG: O-antigen ligase family protein [Novosphingobium sp.]